MIYYAHKNRRTEDGSFWFGERRDEDTATLSERISGLLDKALVEKTRAEYEAGRGSGEGDVAKKRIGAGYIGTECARELAFRYHKAPKEERDGPVKPGELQRHAEAGHWTEKKTAEWLRLAGFTVLTEKEDGSQYGFKTARCRNTGQFRIAGEVDGVVRDVPALLSGTIPTPCIWESKKATDKKWKKFSSKGVKEADPKYYGQVQTCMAFMEIEAVLFSMLNLDNMKYYWELIPFDQRYAQQLYDRAIDVLQSETPFALPRIATVETDFRCKFCDYQGQCWEKAATAAPLEAPGWLAQGA